ncbi:MAG: AsmA-like C-terminal domain-containing protein [Flavobacteriaceae bacterium]
MAQITAGARVARFGRVAMALARRRWVRVAALAVVVLVLLVAGLAGILSWRLSQGPLAEAFLTERIGERLKAAIPPGVQWSFSRAAIEKSDEGRVELVIHDLAVSDPAEGSVRAPRIVVRPRWGALLVGQAEARSIEIIDAVIGLPPSGGSTPGIPDLRGAAFGSIAAVKGVVDALGIRWIGLYNAQIGEAPAEGDAQHFDVEVHTLESAANEIRLALFGKGTDGLGWTAELDVARAGEGADVALIVTDLAPDRVLLPLAPALADAQISTPVTGRLDVSVNGIGRLTALKFDATLGAGFIGVSPDHRVLIDEAQVGGFWEPSQEQLVISPSKVLAARTEVVFRGGVTIPGSGSFSSGKIPFRIDFGQSKISGDGISDPVTFDRGVVAGVYHVARDVLRIDRLDAGSPDAAIAAVGLISNLRRDPSGRIEGSIASMPVDTLKRVWPPFAAPGAREWVVSNILSGDVTNVGFAVQIPPGAIEGDGSEIAGELDFDVDAVDFTYLGELPPIRGATGHAKLTNHTFTLDMRPGAFVRLADGSRIAVGPGRFHIPDLTLEAPQGIINLSLSGDAGAVMDLLDHEPLKLATRRNLDTDAISGRSEAKLRIELPLVQEVRLEDSKVHIDASVGDLKMAGGAGRTDVAGGSLKIISDGENVSVSGQALINGVQADVAITDTLFGTGAAEQRVTTILDAEERRKFGFALDDVIVGKLPAEIMEETDSRGRAVTRVHLDLTPVRLTYPAIGLDKPAGAAAEGSFTIVREKNGTALEDIVITGSGIDVKGSAKLDQNGAIRSADLPTFRLRRADDASVKVSRSGSTLNLTLRGNALDVRSVITATFSPAKDGDAAKTALSLDAKLDRAIGNDGQTINDLSLSLQQSGGRISQLTLDGRHDSGAAVSGRMGGGGSGASVLTITSGDGGALLRWVGAYSNMAGGSLQLVARLGDKQGAADGGLQIRNFRIVGDQGLDRLVVSGEQETLRAAPNTMQRGPIESPDSSNIAFDLAEVRFAREGNRIRLRDGIVRNAAMGATGSGEVDFAAQRLSIAGTYVPLYAINSIFGKIPLIGTILGGRRNEGLIGISYSIRGSIDNPIMTVNPVSAVTPGVFRFIFNIDPGSATGGSAPPRPMRVDPSR